MQFNVSELLKEGTGATREFDIDDEVKLDGEPRRLAGRVRFDRTPAGILVRAHLSGNMSDDCSRCLRPLSYPVIVEFDEEYVPSVDVMTGAHINPPEDAEEAYRIDPRHILDLSEPVQQYWSMALPMAPVCREDCAGLCPSCGAPVESSRHERCSEPQDDRWAALRDLKLR